MENLLLIGVVFALLMTGSALCLWRISRTGEAVAARMRMAQSHAIAGHGASQAIGPLKAAQPQPAGSALRVPLQFIAGIGHTILRSGIMSSNTLAALGHTMQASGLRSANALPMFVGAKLLLLVAMPAIAWLLIQGMTADPTSHIMAPAIAACIGLVAPDYVIRKIRAGYIARVEAGVPDAIDMMVICARAGLSMEPAITRVADEVRHARPEVARELAQTAAEMHVVADARVALQNLGLRTDLESLRRLTATLVQTMEYGTPLVESLRILSAEMRTAVLTRAEEKAARLPVMLTVPMILFILPCQFIIAAGPAFLQISKAFSN